jgi:tetratricopeptide (TPR) repeat protein
MPLPLTGVIAGILIALGALSQPGAPSYLNIVDRYRAGEFDAAIGQLIANEAGHSRQFVMRELVVTPQSDRTGVTDLGSLRKAEVASSRRAAAAAMHLEAGYDLLQRGEGERGLAHISIAEAIVGWRPSAAPAPDRRPPNRRTPRAREEVPRGPSARDPFAILKSDPVFSAAADERAERTRQALQREIDIGILWTYQTYRIGERAAKHLQTLRVRYPRDADVLLALGTSSEQRGVTRYPLVIRRTFGVDPLAPPVAVSAARRAEAIEYFRAALGLDPEQAEAGVRLGRVLLADGQLQGARAALEDALDPEPPMMMHYLGSMFLAQVIAAQGDADGALARYRAITARWPECQSAHIALSRAHALRGEHEAAARALESLRLEHSARACGDPWWGYNLGQAWRWGGFVESLRARVRTK